MLVILLSCFVAVCHVIYSLQTLRVPILFHTVQPQLLCQLVTLECIMINPGANPLPLRNFGIFQGKCI